MATALVACSLAGGTVAQVITIDLVTMGNAGNTADTSTYGAVAYS